jgi:hypothetical protein
MFVLQIFVLIHINYNEKCTFSYNKVKTAYCCGFSHIFSSKESNETSFQFVCNRQTSGFSAH